MTRGVVCVCENVSGFISLTSFTYVRTVVFYLVKLFEARSRNRMHGSATRLLPVAMEIFDHSANLFIV